MFFFLNFSLEPKPHPEVEVDERHGEEQRAVARYRRVPEPGEGTWGIDQRVARVEEEGDGDGGEGNVEEGEVDF